jgi:hypothetical protein
VSCVEVVLLPLVLLFLALAWGSVIFLLFTFLMHLLVPLLTCNSFPLLWYILYHGLRLLIYVWLFQKKLKLDW